MVARHLPVLAEQVAECLAAVGSGWLVDLTVGLGGHGSAVLERAPGLRLLGLDRDPRALDEAGRRLAGFAGRVRLERATFDELPRVLATLDQPPAAILADLGVSSLQLDDPERGFSFQADGPLDMRMGDDGPTAADLVNHAPEEELMRILREWGEERRARAVTRAIVARRSRRPLTRTGELAEVVRSVLGGRRDGAIDPATRTFQGLRIAVNDELGQVERMVEPAVRALRPGGRAAFIAFHSLEDRIVKRTLRRLEGRCVCPPGLPVCACRPVRVVRPLTRGALRPSDAEVAANPRARSARLRAVERLEVG